MEFRSGYFDTHEKLVARLGETAPGRVQILTGPRQVGKTHLLLDIERTHDGSVYYYAADAPEASLSGWWELMWQRVLQSARTGKVILLLDEIHYLPGWPRLVKSAIDQVYRENLPIHMVITGSAALQVTSGTRETMAGRFERLVLRQWTPSDLARAFSLTTGEAVEMYVRFGSFPGGMNIITDKGRWKSYLRDSIIDPALGRDLLMLQQIRKPGLLRQVFAVTIGHPGEILSLAKIAGEIRDEGTLETIAHYLNILEEAYLVSAVRKYAAREYRRRASSAKVIPLSNAFLAASLHGNPPLPSTDPARWGRWVENACLAFAAGCDQKVHYWREEPLEVDFISEGSWGQWAVEVKTGAFAAKDLAGLYEFCRRWPEYSPLLLCDEDALETARRMGLNALAWNEYLWSGPCDLQ